MAESCVAVASASPASACWSIESWSAVAAAVASGDSAFAVTEASIGTAALAFAATEAATGAARSRSAVRSASRSSSEVPSSAPSRSVTAPPTVSTVSLTAGRVSPTVPSVSSRTPPTVSTVSLSTGRVSPTCRCRQDAADGLDGVVEHRHGVADGRACRQDAADGLDGVVEHRHGVTDRAQRVVQDAADGLDGVVEHRHGVTDRAQRVVQDAADGPDRVVDGRHGGSRLVEDRTPRCRRRRRPAARTRRQPGPSPRCGRPRFQPRPFGGSVVRRRGGRVGGAAGLSRRPVGRGRRLRLLLGDRGREPSSAAWDRRSGAGGRVDVLRRPAVLGGRALLRSLAGRIGRCALLRCRARGLVAARHGCRRLRRSRGGALGRALGASSATSVGTGALSLAAATEPETPSLTASTVPLTTSRPVGVTVDIAARSGSASAISALSSSSESPVVPFHLLSMGLSLLAGVLDAAEGVPMGGPIALGRSARCLG